MRIAIFHNLPSGGGKRALFEWTRRLASRHSIDVFSLTGADHAFCDISPFAATQHMYSFSSRRLFRSPWGRLNQWQRWRDLCDLSRTGRQIAEDIDGNGYDVVFAHTCIYTFIPAFLPHVQIPTVYYLHEPFGKAFARNYHRHNSARQKWRAMIDRVDPILRLYNRRLQAIQRASIARTTRLLANSQFTQQEIAKGFGRSSRVCHCGVDCRQFRPQPMVSKGNHVLSVGELSPRKGFDFLVESLAIVPCSVRPALRVACNAVDGDEEAYLRSLAARYGVNVTVMVNLTGDQLCAEYNAARLCVYAPVLEPFGLVPLEAMACGTPVLAVDEGGVAESVISGETGMVVQRDRKFFAEALQTLLTNPILLEIYGRQAREQVLANWTWERSAALIEEQLLSCAGERSYTGGGLWAPTRPEAAPRLM